VQARYDEIRRAGSEVLVVTQARPDLLALFLRDHPLPCPIVGDPSRQAYREFGLGETRWRTFLRPGVLLRYLTLIFRGWKPRAPSRGEDVLQLGGDFVLDRNGRIVFAYRSTEPTDRPTVDEVLQAVREASGTV